MTKQREAFDLRDRGCSIRMIAAITGVPRSTVGGWLAGYGETVYDLRCEHCGDSFVAFNVLRRFCGTSCAARAWDKAHPDRAREQQKRHSDRTRERYRLDPEFRERVLERQRQRRKKEAWMKRQREYERNRYWTDEEYRAYKIAYDRERRANPEIRERDAARRRTEEYRARKNARERARYARLKAAA